MAAAEHKTNTPKLKAKCKLPSAEEGKTKEDTPLIGILVKNGRKLVDKKEHSSGKRAQTIAHLNVQL